MAFQLQSIRGGRIVHHCSSLSIIAILVHPCRSSGHLRMTSQEGWLELVDNDAQRCAMVHNSPASEELQMTCHLQSNGRSTTMAFHHIAPRVLRRNPHEAASGRGERHHQNTRETRLHDAGAAERGQGGIARRRLMHNDVQRCTMMHNDDNSPATKGL